MAEIGMIELHPNGTADENDLVWKTVLQEARDNPDKVIALVLHPGNYELENGTMLTAANPGIQVMVRMSSGSGRLHIGISQVIPSLALLQGYPGKPVQPDSPVREAELKRSLEKRFGEKDTPPGLATAEEVFGKEYRLEDERFSYNKPDIRYPEGGAIV